MAMWLTWLGAMGLFVAIGLPNVALFILIVFVCMLALGLVVRAWHWIKHGDSDEYSI